GGWSSAARDPSPRRGLHDRDLPVTNEPPRVRARLEPRRPRRRGFPDPGVRNGRALRSGGSPRASPRSPWTTVAARQNSVLSLRTRSAGCRPLSGIGTQADARLSAHMVEHMVMWVVVAPLLTAGAPIRLALYALPPAGRRRLGRWLHARTVRALTRPVGCVALFAAVVLVTHLP